MTTDIELLPMPEPDIGMPGQVAFIRSDNLLQEWCRANVLHHTTTMDTEIEALRADLADYIAAANSEATRSERLAEALRLYMSAGFGNSTDFYKQAEAKRVATEALYHTTEQENDSE